jgi:hypothetical protein
VEPKKGAGWSQKSFGSSLLFTFLLLLPPSRDADDLVMPKVDALTNILAIALRLI